MRVKGKFWTHRIERLRKTYGKVVVREYIDSKGVEDLLMRYYNLLPLDSGTKYLEAEPLFWSLEEEAQRWDFSFQTRFGKFVLYLLIRRKIRYYDIWERTERSLKRVRSFQELPPSLCGKDGEIVTASMCRNMQVIGLMKEL